MSGQPRQRFDRSFILTEALLPAPCQISSDRSGAIRRATFRRLPRAVFRLERTFCGPCRAVRFVRSHPCTLARSNRLRLLTARRNQIREHVGVFPIVEAPRKFIDVQRQIFFGDLVIAAHDAALEQRPEALDCCWCGACLTTYSPAV